MISRIWGTSAPVFSFGADPWPVLMFSRCQCLALRGERWHRLFVLPGGDSPWNR
nr:MAG TPA: hypothetical protein [Caudoviricetes sp.]